MFLINKRIFIILIIPLLVMLGACQSKKDPVSSNQVVFYTVTDNPVSQEIQPTETQQPSATITLTPTALVTETPQWTATPEATLTPVLPDEHHIEIAGYRQWFALSCEARAAVDWAGYFDVTIYEYNFQHELPLSDNPDFGFVGAVNGPWGQIPPYAYGVHAEPVAALLRDYGLKAVAYKKYSIEQIREQIAADKPVIAWVIGNVEGGVPYIFTDAAGNEVQVGAYEHVVIVTGYAEGKIRYLNNGRFYDVPEDVFDNSWSVLDRMVIVWED